MITGGNSHSCTSGNQNIQEMIDAMRSLRSEGVQVPFVAFDQTPTRTFDRLGDIARAGGGDRVYEARPRIQILKSKLKTILASFCAYEVSSSASTIDPNQLWIERLDTNSYIPADRFTYDPSTRRVVLDTSLCRKLQKEAPPGGTGPDLKITAGCPPSCSPSMETCNYEDDDLDGQVDEVAKCQGCTLETCDGEDDDCDDEVDEGRPPCVFEDGGC